MFFPSCFNSTWRLLLLYLCTAAPVTAQYRFDHWTADNGLPQNSLRDIVQTRDGYLWMTTFDGLVRFDGVRFTVFNKSNTPGLASNRFFNLFEDRFQADLAVWRAANQTWYMRCSAENSVLAQLPGQAGRRRWRANACNCLALRPATFRRSELSGGSSLRFLLGWTGECCRDKTGAPGQYKALQSTQIAGRTQNCFLTN